MVDDPVKADTNLTAYCVKCRTTRPISEPQAVFMANGRPATRGVCPECGTGLFKIGATANHAGLPAPEVAARPAGKPAKAGSARRTPRSAGKRPAGEVSGKGPALHGDRLVIVESPAKARTVGRFLGSGYDVRASVGHVRDLLRSRLSVDVDHDFAPTYRVTDEKREVVKGLKQAAADARQIYLATDPDREGEAIAWHLLEAAQIPPERTRRVVFHEITKGAVSEAFAHSRDIDMSLVDAQQARRILDRLVGYEVSPLLWDRVKSGLSAGRVQSVALRLIVEREREIAAFVPVEYWSLDAELAQQLTRGQRSRPSFLARLIRIRGEEADLKGRQDAEAVLADLEGAIYVVSSVKRGERRRRPNPPFTTSTLQQDAAQRLGMAAARTMRVAQELYEGIDTGDGEGPVGLITYMRTDSVNVAQEAQAEARALIAAKYGSDYLPSEPNVYRSRAKNAQEAHEAIRPTSSHRLPATLRERLSRDQYRLYELIWQRFVASQMAAAIYDTMTVEVEAGSSSLSERPYLFRARGSKVRFSGFLVVYSGGSTGPENGSQGPEASDGAARSAGAAPPLQDLRQQPGDAAPWREELAEQEILPDVAPGEELDLIRLLPEQHFTQPPPRYSEATLIKTLEENGIGRPSTYAVIISTILDRGYVAREDRKLVPTELGTTVNDLLVKYFDTIFNVGFTAGMEEHLDGIARGQEQMVPVLRDFYAFFQPQVEHAERTMEKVLVAPEKTGETCPKCGGDLVIKAGRYGRFVGCSNYPACSYTAPLVSKVGVPCPKDGGEIVERRSKKGRLFYGCANYPACDFVSWKRPLPQRCPNCGGLLVAASKTVAECTQCAARVAIEAVK
jgi:DNA topoisomerase-1